MPSPPTAPCTVTEPISSQSAVHTDVELVDDPVSTGLDVEVLPTDGCRGVN